MSDKTSCAIGCVGEANLIGASSLVLGAWCLVLILWRDLCEDQFALKQVCEQNEAIFTGRPSFMQVGHFIEAGLPHATHLTVDVVVDVVAAVVVVVVVVVEACFFSSSTCSSPLFSSPVSPPPVAAFDFFFFFFFFFFFCCCGSVSASSVVLGSSG